MTLPASGAISIGAINTETGVAATTNKALTWLNGNLKSWNSQYNFTQSYSKAWYQKTNAYFNCTLDNRDSQCNCNNCNCQCSNPSAWQLPSSTAAYGACSNCACDNRSWLQTNCNTPTYNNCNYNCYYTNCNCNCACRC